MVLSNLTLWAGVVAFFIPLLLAFLNQSHWSKLIKGLTFFVASMIAAAGTAYFQGDLTGKRFIDAALIILAGGIVFYQGFWKSSTIAPLVERLTTFGPNQPSA